MKPTGIGLLNHADIVATITNGTCSFARVFLDQRNDLSFLSWIAATAHNSWTLCGQFHELHLIIMQAHI